MGKLTIAFLIILMIVILAWLVFEIVRWSRRAQASDDRGDMEQRLELEELTNRLEIQMDHQDARERVKKAYRDLPRKKGK